VARKICIVGAGTVGTTTAQRLAEDGHFSLILIDGDGGRARARALDVAAAGVLHTDDAKVTGTDDWADLSGAMIIVITEGDATTVREAASHIAEHAPDAVVVVAAEPVDPLTHLVLFTTLFPRRRVLGVGGAIDSARFAALIAAELTVSAQDVRALVIGEHGETAVPLASSATVAGVALRELLPADRLGELERRVRDRGDGDDLQARGAAAAEVARAIARDSRRVLSCCVLCEGELGLDRVSLSVPVRLGRGGVQEIVDVPLSDEERAGLERSAGVVRERVAALVGEGERGGAGPDAPA
jgi:malate dehydrogenase